MYNMLFKTKKNYHILILLFITFIISVPLFYGKFVLIDDANFHVERIHDLAESLKQGIFRPYIYSTALMGYGYANPVFYPDLFLYIPAIINLFNINLSICYKIFIAITTFSTGITAYYCINKINNNDTSTKLSLIFSCIYMAFPYRLYDLYYRNAIGEVLFFIFFPLVILGLFDIFNKDKWKTLVIGCTCICYAHVLSLFMTVIFIGIVYILNIKKINKKIVVNTLKAMSISFLLCVNLILPMLEMFKYDTFFVNVSNPFGLLSSNAIILSSVANKNMYIPAIIFVIFICAIFIVYKKIKKISPIIYMLLISLVCFIISTNLFPWDLLSIICPAFNKIQFPWRINCFTAFFMSMFLALSMIKLIEFFKKRNLKVSLFLLCFLPMFLLTLFIGFTYNIYTTVKYQYDTDFIPCSIGRGEYLPVGFMNKFGSNYDDIQSLAIKVKERRVLINENNYDNISLNIEKNKTFIDIKNIPMKKCKIELPFTYYKGYSTFLDGNKINCTKSDKGLVQIEIENISNCHLEIIYEGTIIQKISLNISLLTFILLMVFNFKKKYNKKNDFLLHI